MFTFKLLINKSTTTSWKRGKQNGGDLLVIIFKLKLNIEAGLVLIISHTFSGITAYQV